MTDSTACTECGHRNVEHVAGREPCKMPGCPCPVGKD